MYDEHSFPRAAWMGLWKATPILLQSLLILGFLRGSQTLLAQCKALGSWHRRFLQLHPSQQRNVSLYVTHICLDTVCLLAVARPMMELWLGMTETAGDVRAGGVGFTYLSALYILELTWRNSVDFMLVMHHLGTIIVILIYAGELTVSCLAVYQIVVCWSSAMQYCLPSSRCLTQLPAVQQRSGLAENRHQLWVLPCLLMGINHH